MLKDKLKLWKKVTASLMKYQQGYMTSLIRVTEENQKRGRISLFRLYRLSTLQPL